MLLALLALPVMGSMGVNGTTGRDPIEPIRASLSKNAPYKQWDVTTNAPNRQIGRTPGATCEAISFLVRDAQTNGRDVSMGEAKRLAEWIMRLQQKGATLPVPGGVPSTPDLAGAASTYHYAIDAAFCGTAMLDLADATGDKTARYSANRFGRFFVSLMRDAGGTAVTDTSRGRAPCEAVVQGAGEPSWNCTRYVKNLVALPLLARLDRTDPQFGFGAAAKDLRTALMPGLNGLWEYADGPLSSPRWHRVQGPHGERDMFVYGDTLAYGLKGLHAYEGASADVRRLYADFTTPRERVGRTRSYDPNIALAGYVVARTRSADPYSAYYDIVTMGLMDDVRAEVDPAGAVRAEQVLRRNIGTSDRFGWHMDMAFRPQRTGMADASTLSAVGQALLRERPKG
jgi:hypothetical protein